MLAVALLSDDPGTFLAVSMVKDRGIKVVGLWFTSPFGRCRPGPEVDASEIASRLDIQLVPIPQCHDYLELVREPRFDRGSEINPCIDCRIHLLKKAKAVADEMGAKFIIIGKSLPPQAASRHFNILKLIEREACMDGRVLRPLSPGLLPETEAERMGWVGRQALAGVTEHRRSRPPQARAEGAADHRCHASGCLLADPNFAAD